MTTKPSFAKTMKFKPVIEWIAVDDKTDEWNNPIPEDVLYQFNIDPLAYIVKWSRDTFRSIAQHGRVGDLLANRAKLEKEIPHVFAVSDLDLAQAEEIRDYYRAKLVNIGLRGEVLTPFRKRMYTVVENNRSVNLSEIGILYRLPDFYVEDTFMDGVMENAVTVSKSILGQAIEDDFVYLGKIGRTTRHVKQQRYWFRNTKNQLACFYVGSRANPAIPILDQYLQTGRRYCIADQNAQAMCLVGQDPNFYAYYLGQNYTIQESK